MSRNDPIKRYAPRLYSTYTAERIFTLFAFLRVGAEEDYTVGDVVLSVTS